MSARSKNYDEAPSLPQADQADGCPHPREVYSLVGHDEAQTQFAQNWNANKLHHAWLITGPKGIGKATLAYRMVRTVLGGQPQSQGQLDVPATDPVAQRVQSLGHGDFLPIRRPYDLKTKKFRSEIPVAETRKITGFFSKMASEGGWRVCLIDSIDEMNRSATNAVLKTLEEPPNKCLILLLSKAPGRLLPTIRSRCMELPLRAVEPSVLAHWLGERTDASEQDRQTAALMAGGAPGRAFALAQNVDTVIKPLRGLLNSFPNPSGQMIHMISDALSSVSAKVSYDLFCDSLLDVLYAQAVYAQTGEWNTAFQPIAKQRSAVEWMDMHHNIKSDLLAQAGLNMNKKTVLMNLLYQIGA